MKTSGVLAVSMAVALAHAVEGSDSANEAPTQRTASVRRLLGRGSTRAEFVSENRERQKALRAEGKRASDDLRRQVREEVISQKINLAPLRQEIGYSLEQAKLQAREQTRKLADETKEVLRIRTRGGM